MALSGQNKCFSRCDSPLGDLVLASDGKDLTGLWFDGQNSGVRKDGKEKDLPVFREVHRWLELYFSGREPGFTPPLRLEGTAFQKLVWELLLSLPYGHTATYGELAGEVARRRGTARMSAQAVGGALGRNPVLLIVPCHRVLGGDGSLTGYAGGLDRKAKLLALEGICLPDRR